MLPDRVSNPGRLTYESGALPIALRGPALPGIDISRYIPSGQWVHFPGKQLGCFHFLPQFSVGNKS